ncbi:MAG: winged helix domain-containing protein, partial [Halothiobacillaceae bacterium]
GAVAEALVDRIPPKLRYADPDLDPQGNPGEISAAALTKLTRLVREALTPDDAALQRILGEWLTERNLNLGGLFPDNEPLSLDKLREMVEDGTVLRRVPAARLAFIPQPSKVLFFMDGECVELPEAERGMVEMLCREQHFDAEAVDAHGEAIWPLLHRLYTRGCLMFTDDE